MYLLVLFVDFLPGFIIGLFLLGWFFPYMSGLAYMSATLVVPAHYSLGDVILVFVENVPPVYFNLKLKPFSFRVILFFYNYFIRSLVLVL